MPEHRKPLYPDLPPIERLADDPGEALLRAEAEVVARENAEVRDRYRTLNELEEQQQERRGVTRRTFFAGVAATMTALATSQFVATRASFGATPGGTLIHLFLYGGLDGLALVAPADDGYLRTHRPDLVLPENGSIPIARNFKLTGAFAPLQSMLDAGRVAFIPGVADPRLSRSHFQAQDACNLGGLPSETGGRGFLDALLDHLGPGTTFRSVGIGTTLPRSLIGTNASLAINSVGSFSLNGDRKFREPTTAAIRELFTGINHPLEGVVAAGLSALAQAQQISSTPYQPAEGVTYTGSVAAAFRELAMLIKRGANVRVATIGTGGYDTHENEEPHEGGYLYQRLNDLATALVMFYLDLGEQGDDVTVMISTEFGRRVAQTGSGTDHGHGGPVILLTGRNRRFGSSLLGTWRGFESLVRGDIPEYNNMFDVFGSVIKARFGLSDAEVSTIFPNHTFTPMQLFA
jgi:uncharacterized protein (DUF1501 family)